tara:strand:+ start:14647 stop:15333 length:687 start_codon:yes stop_codon:yes gene_type:complete
MALTLLKDESELQNYVTSNPTSYIVVKGYYYVGLDPTVVQQYKNVLTGENGDYLSLDNEIVLTGNWHIESLYSSLTESNSQTPFSYEAGGDWDNNVVQTYSSGRVYMAFDDGQVANFTTLDTIPRTGTFKLKIEKVGLDVNIYVDDIYKDTKTLSIDTIYKLDTFGNLLTSRYFDGEFFWVDINGELFPLNEPSGATFTGSLGSTGTRNTSSLDPNYINDVMIQPYTP